MTDRPRWVVDEIPFTTSHYSTGVYTPHRAKLGGGMRTSGLLFLDRTSRNKINRAPTSLMIVLPKGDWRIRAAQRLPSGDRPGQKRSGAVMKRRRAQRMTSIGRVVAHRAIYAGAVIGALSTSIFETLTAAGMPIAFASTAISHIPLANAGFAWTVPGVVGAIVGFVLSKNGFGSPIPSIVEFVEEPDEAAAATG